jgi:hypothetical protein
VPPAGRFLKKKSSLLRNLGQQIGFAIKIANLLRKPQLVANAAKTFCGKGKLSLWIAIWSYGRVTATKKQKSAGANCVRPCFVYHEKAGGHLTNRLGSVILMSI